MPPSLHSRLRRLSDSERAALPKGLVSALENQPVVLISAPHPLSRMMSAFGSGSLIVVRGDRIFWPRVPDDLSTRPETLGLLAHELTHVWQYANGMRLWRYLWREVRQFPHVYAYDLLPGKTFTAYGYEQQAAMVEDWVRLRAGIAPRWSRAHLSLTALEALIPFANPAI